MQMSHYIKSWSKPQSLIALSSPESELYALVNASAEANALSICDQRPETIVDHGLLQRRQRSLGCGTTSRLGETQTRGQQFLVQADPERAEGGATRESVREQHSSGCLHQGPQC